MPLGEEAALGPGALGPAPGVAPRLVGDGVGRADLAGQIGRRGRRLREDARQAAAAAAAAATAAAALVGGLLLHGGANGEGGPDDRRGREGEHQ